MASNSYAQHLLDSGLAANPTETANFNLVMDYIMRHIEKPDPELVRTALTNAPPEILDYLAQDKWFAMSKSEKDVPIYSTIAREILLERIVLGGTERK